MGIRSLRKLQQVTQNDTAFIYLAAMQNEVKIEIDITQL
jgi:transposase